MQYAKTFAVITAGLVIAGSASAAGQFSFDYTYDSQAVQTQQGAVQVLQDLEQQVASECEDRRIFPRSVRDVMSRHCVANTLETAVTEIDSPALDQAFEDWKSSH